MSAYTAIASTTLTSAAASVTFSSIPQDFRDLVLIYNVTATANIFTGGEFNGVTTDFNFVRMQGNGTSPDSGTSTSFVPFGGVIASGRTVMGIYQIMDYAQTDKHKSFLMREDDAASRTIAYAGRWANTAALTSIALTASSSTYPAGSTFSLYGIAA